VGQQLADGRFLLVVNAQVSEARFLALQKKNAKSTAFTTLPIQLSSEELQVALAQEITAAEIPLVVGALKVLLTFDNDVPEEQVNAITDAVKRAVVLDPERGDTVEVKKAPLQSPSATKKKEVESLNTKVLEGSKDVEKLRFDVSSAQQRTTETQQRVAEAMAKVTQVEAEKLKLQTDLRAAEARAAAEKDKAAAAKTALDEETATRRRLEEDLSIYKTPMGDIKKIVKGLELPLTVLPVALLLFVFAAAAFFIYLRFQGAKTSKFMEAAEAMAQALVKAGRGPSGGASQGMTLDAARNDLGRMLASQTEEASKASHVPQNMLGEELASTRKEALEAWDALREYPYLTFAELREWLWSGGTPAGRLVSLLGALGPVESLRVLQSFAPEDLDRIRTERQENASKLPGYAALLQLHRNVVAEAIQCPACIAKLDFPALVRSTDERLATALDSCSPASGALTLSLLPGQRKTTVFDLLSKETLERCVDGFAMIQDLPSRELDSLLRKTIEELLPGLEQAALPRIAVAQKVSELLSDTSVRARGLLQTSLAKHGSLLATVNQKRVTFEDVLALEDETLAELLDEVDAEQIAALALGLAEPAQAKVARVLSRKVQMAVRAEMQRLQARQATLRRAQGQSLEIQAALVERVKGLVEEGVVDLKRGPTSPSSGPSGRLPPGKESA
jgi:hypothetical protein